MLVWAYHTKYESHLLIDYFLNTETITSGRVLYTKIIEKFKRLKIEKFIQKVHHWRYILVCRSFFIVDILRNIIYARRESRWYFHWAMGTFNIGIRDLPQTYQQHKK